MLVEEIQHLQMKDFEKVPGDEKEDKTDEDDDDLEDDLEDDDDEEEDETPENLES